MVDSNSLVFCVVEFQIPSTQNNKGAEEKCHTSNKIQYPPLVGGYCVHYFREKLSHQKLTLILKYFVKTNLLLIEYYDKFKI